MLFQLCSLSAREREGNVDLQKDSPGIRAGMGRVGLEGHPVRLLRIQDLLLTGAPGVSAISPVSWMRTARPWEANKRQNWKKQNPGFPG